MNFNDKYFSKIPFTKDQIIKNLHNAQKDLSIAKNDRILDVKFNYAYTALLKMGITLLSYYHIKVRSVPGHHTMTIDKMSEILNDETINDIGNVMRSKRNVDLYGGGIEITVKECKEYIEFVEKVFYKVKKYIKLNKK